MAFKKLHKTHMTIFAEEVNEHINKIEKILNKKQTSEAIDSILNSNFTKKPQEIKNAKLKRLGSLDESKFNLVSDEVLLGAIISHRNEKLNIYEKHKEFENKRNISMIQLRNEKGLNETNKLKEKPYVSNKSKMIMTIRDTKPIFMRVREDEEIKERNLSILKKNIEEEKNYFSEININPLKLKKSQISSDYNTSEKAQRFENWFETNSKWSQKLKSQKQVLYELKQNEIEHLKIINFCSSRTIQKLQNQFSRNIYIYIYIHTYVYIQNAK